MRSSLWFVTVGGCRAGLSQGLSLLSRQAADGESEEFMRNC